MGENCQQAGAVASRKNPLAGEREVAGSILDQKHNHDRHVILKLSAHALGV